MSDVFNSNFDHLVKNFFDNEVREEHPRAYRPHTDITESEDAFSIALSLPGIKKEEIKISLNNNVLEVSGERKSEKKENTAQYRLKEIHYGKFARRFELPENVDADKINAEMEDGILNLSIPKSEEKKPRLIDVK